MSRRAALWFGAILIAAAALAAGLRMRFGQPPATPNVPPVASAALATPTTEDSPAHTDEAVGPATLNSLAYIRKHPPRRIDAHTHVDPAGLVPLMKMLKANGIDGLLNLSGGSPGRGLEAQLAAASAFPHRVAVFCNLDWRGVGRPGWVQHQVLLLEQAKGLGAAGLKISKALGLAVRTPGGALLKVDDPKLDPIFEAAGRLGFPVAMHVGDPRAFFDPPTQKNPRIKELALHPKWSFYGKDYPSWLALRQAFLDRVMRHPKTTFIGVHFGNSPEDPAWVREALRVAPNLMIDTAARLPEILRELPVTFHDATARVFQAYPDRVLFGSDTMLVGAQLVLGAPAARPHNPLDAALFFRAHWRLFQTADKHIPSPSPIQGLALLQGLGLRMKTLQAFYSGNLERLLPQLRLPQADETTAAATAKKTGEDGTAKP